MLAMYLPALGGGSERDRGLYSFAGAFVSLEQFFVVGRHAKDSSVRDIFVGKVLDV